MKAYTFTLENDGNEVEVSLRLTASGEMKLKEKYKGKSTSEIIGESVNDIEIMCDLLTQCLNYKDNTNTIKKGSELYDLIVDNGMGGARNWQKITSEIAYASGKYDYEEREVILNQIDTEFNRLVNGEYEEPVKNA